VQAARLHSEAQQRAIDAARARKSADQAFNEKATVRARIESQAAELARAREQEEKGAIATARARAQAEARAETAERIRSQADQCASALAEEQARAEALALEAERRKVEAARTALGAAEARAKAEAEARSLAAARSRTGAELAELRTRLRALWSARLGTRATLAARYAAIGVAVVALGYLALRPAATPPAPVANDPPSLKLDYELRMGTRP
jgi:hypothetical protein